jgi:hypothetical protein
MITSLENYFAYEAARPRSRAEQQADDARAADIVASLTRAPAALTVIARRLLLFHRSELSAGERDLDVAEVGRLS